MCDLELERTTEMVFMCLKCKKAFRKDINEDFEEADEYCPHCDNHYIIEAKTPLTEGKMVIGFQHEKGHDHQMFKDERMKDRAKALMDMAGELSDESDEIDLCC